MRPASEITGGRANPATVARERSPGARGDAEGITGQLEHPNILPVYGYGRDRRGRRFLCMKLVEGNTLDAALSLLGDARLDASRLGEFLQIFVKVCDAVSFAHSRGVIHRDLKPSNIMVSGYGQVYVLDWGIARLLPAAPSHVRRVQVLRRKKYVRSRIEGPSHQLVQGRMYDGCRYCHGGSLRR